MPKLHLLLYLFGMRYNFGIEVQILRILLLFGSTGRAWDHNPGLLLHKQIEPGLSADCQLQPMGVSYTLIVHPGPDLPLDYIGASLSLQCGPGDVAANQLIVKTSHPEPLAGLWRIRGFWCRGRAFPSGDFKLFWEPLIPCACSPCYTKPATSGWGQETWAHFKFKYAKFYITCRVLWLVCHFMALITVSILSVEVASYPKLYLIWKLKQYAA